MRQLRLAFCAAVTALLVTGSFGARNDMAAVAASGSASAGASLDQASASVVIGDFRGLLDKAGAMAARVAPNFDAAMLRQQAGAMLGDPDLSGMPAGNGIAVVVFGQGMVTGYVEVADAKAASYAQLARTRGMRAQKAGNLVVIGVNDDALSAALKVAPEVAEKLLGGKGEPTLVATVPVSKLLEMSAPFLNNAIDGLVANASRDPRARAEMGDMSTTAAAKIIRAELQMFLEMAKGIQTAKITLAPSEAGLRITDVLTMMKAPGAAPAATAEQARKLIPVDGAYRLAFSIRPEAFKSLMEEVKPILQEAGLQGADTLIEFGSKWATIMDGSAAMNMIVSGGKPATMVMGVTDEAKTIELVKELPAMFKSPAIQNLYKDLGMPLTFETLDTRKVDGVDVFRFKMDIGTTGTVERQMLQVMGMLGEWEIAVVNKKYIASMGGGGIDKLIAAAKSGSNPESKALQAEQKFGPGGLAYVDYGLAELMQIISSAAKDQARAEMSTLAKNVAGAPPLVFGVFREAKGYRVEVDVPSELISKFAEAGRQMKSANQQQKPALRTRTSPNAQTTGSVE